MSQQSPTKTPSSNKKHLGPYKEQEPFLKKDKRFTGFISGVGAGKSHIGIARVAKNVEQWNPGEMGAIVAPASRMIKDTILPLMEEYNLIGPNGAWEYETSYAEKPGIHAPNGARVLILSADNKRTVERLKGLNLAHWWIDERAEVPERAQQILQQRLRVGNYRNGFITTTPNGYDSVYDFFVGDVETERYKHGQATIYEAADRRAIVGVPTSANPFTPDDYKESMAKLPEEIRAQEVQGEFVEIGSGVFKRDMLHFCTPDEINEDWQLQYILGVDPATQADSTKARETDSDYWAATLAAVHRRGQTIYVLDTKRQRGMSLKQGVGWISQIAGQVPNPKLFVESNQSQDWLRQELADKGLNAVPVNSTRNKEERLIDLSIPIENGTAVFVNHDRDEQLGYDPRWQNLIQEMLAFPDGSHDDQLDSLGLTVRNADIGTQSILSANMYKSKDE